MNPNPLMAECGRACDEFVALQHSLTIVTAERDALRIAALDFIAKVDRGQASSVDSYNKFKRALNHEIHRPLSEHKEATDLCEDNGG